MSETINCLGDRRTTQRRRSAPSRVQGNKSSLLASITLVSIVPGPALAQPAKWTFDEKPLISIGARGDGRTAEFAFVNGVTLLPDGNLMVSDRTTDHSMFIVSPTGKVVKKFGRSGSGPGELNNPFFSWACGKQVFVGNNGNSSMSVFDLEGTHVRSYRIGTGIGKQGAYRTACNRNGLCVHYAWDNAKGQRPGRYIEPEAGVPEVRMYRLHTSGK